MGELPPGGGGVGIGYSLHAIRSLADGTKQADERLHECSS